MTSYRNGSRLQGFHPSSSLRTSIWARATIPVWAVFLLLILGGCPGTTEQGGPQGTQDLVVDLKDLQPSLGALSPSFDSGTQTYEVLAGPGTKELMLTATVADPRASLKIQDQPWASGQAYGPIPVQAGRNPEIPLVVEALGFSKKYAVVIAVETTPKLKNLEASAGPLDPAFASNKTTYAVTADTNTAATTITATLIDDTAILNINGVGAKSGQPSDAIPLAYGATTIPVVVRTTDGKTETYWVTVNRPPPECATTLTNLMVNQGTLNFNPATQNYVVQVSSGVGSLTVTATAGNNATVNINGQPTTTAQVPLNPAGSSTTITITVDCPGQPTKTYTIRVDREAPCNNNLTTLTVNQGQLSPAFSPSIQNYTVRVGSGVGSLTVTATAATAVSINGQPANSLQVPLNPAGQKTTIPVVVQCPDGTTKTYTIEVEREAPCSTNLTSLTLDGGKIPLAFNSSTQDYNVSVASTVSSLTVAATKQDANATLQIDGQTTNSLLVTLGEPGTAKTIPIVVRCGDGTSKTYRVNVTREKGDATLANLTVEDYGYVGAGDGCRSPYTLTPAFSKTTLSYTVNVEYYISRVCVTATKANPGQTLAYKVNGVSTNSLSPVTLGATGSKTTIAIEVTAVDGVTKNTYTVIVNRAPTPLDTNTNLSNLVISEDFFGGIRILTLYYGISGASGFRPDVTEYYADPSCSFYVTATTPSSKATMTISVNGGAQTSLQSGVRFGPIDAIPGNICLGTTIRITVRAESGATKTYTIDVNPVFG